MKTRYSTLLTTVASMALVSAPAYSQETEAPTEEEVSEEEAITVTGSRIKLPNLQATEPTTTITSEDIEQRNFINVADLLNDLPQVRGSVTPNGGQAGFGQGVNFINNFGLGSNRTLTLINGRRVVSSNAPSVFSAGAPGLQVDTNIIPTLLVKQVDIASTAGAPVYGSDAISGTINFILDDEFDGLELVATTSISERGDNFTYRFEGAYGTSFADGRGHIQVSAFYTETDGVLQNDRQIFLDAIENEPNTIDFNRINPALPLDTGPGDGIPAQVGFFGAALFPLSNNGVIFGGPLGISTATADGLSGNGAFQFDTNGNLIPFTVGVRPVTQATGAPSGLRAFGGDGFVFSDFGQLTSDLRRFGTNIFLNYDVTDNINFYAEGQYFDSRADELVQQPTFNTFLFGAGVSGGLTFDASNPFLTDQAQGVLSAAGVDTFQISRANVGIADVTGFSESELLRFVGGVRGNFELFGNDWNFDSSFNYGQTEVSDFRQGINQQNFTNAVNVTTDAAGNIICDVAPVTQAQAAFAPVADANCVPLNFFGGSPSQEALNYILSNTVTETILEQVVFNVNAGGVIFDFNDNPVAVNVGYEHRNEQGSFTPSEFDQLGLGRAVPIPSVNGEFNLDEVFGELYVPFITPANDSFVHSLTAYARGRYVDNSITGGFFSWSAGGSVAIIEDVEIRGNFTRSFRAPAITELFSPQGNAFAAVPDLCTAANVTGGPNPAARMANCAAFDLAFPNLPEPTLSSQATIPILNGGNPDLDNEESNSWSIGGIIRPRFVPNLAITVDYINIEITDPIESLTTATINQSCFDNNSFDTSDPANGNAFCSLIRRDATGAVINDPLNPGVTTGFVNGFSIQYQGIVGDFSYNTGLESLGLDGRFSLRGNLSVVLERLEDITAVAPARSDAELGDPTWAAQLTANYTEDNWGIGTVINYTGEQLFDRFNREPEDQENDQLAGFVTVDLNLTFITDDDFRLNFVVNNLFDRQCEEFNGFCIVGGISDAFGRQFSVSVSKEF